MRRALKGCLAACLALAGFAVSGPVLAAPLEVRVSYSLVNDWLGLFVGIDQGFFEKHNLRIVPAAIQAPTAVIGSLMAGSTDIGGMSSVTFLQAYENGIPLIMLSGAHALPTKMKIGILARTGSGIKTVKDLTGRKIGVPGIGSILHTVAVGWLMDHGVDRKSVNFIEIPWPQQPDVMKSGQVDAMLTADPSYDRILTQGLGYEFGDIYEAAPPGALLTTYASLKTWQEAHPEAVTNFRAALQDSIDYIQANPQSARASLAKWSKLPEAVVANLPIPTFKVEVGEKQMEWLVNLGKRQELLKGNENVADMIAK